MRTTSKILTWEKAIEQRLLWQKKGKAVAFTNGCFDLLHAGHVVLLEAAKAAANHLIVGLNTDASVRRLKGKSRPICDTHARARLLAALACTDAIVTFDEETPLALIQKLSPDVLVKGGDYAEDKIVGAEWVKKKGGKIVIIPLFSVYSTSQMIDKIKHMK